MDQATEDYNEVSPTVLQPLNATIYEESSRGDAWDVYYRDMLQLYLSPFLVFLGTLGNILSITVLLRKRMRSTSIYNFLVILALADTTVLWVSCFKTWIRRLTGYELMHHSVTTCKLINILFLSSCYLASWTIVLMTIERFLAVWYPLRHKSIWSLRQTRMVALGTVILAYGINLHVVWTFDHIEEDNRTFCTYIQDMTFMKKGFKYMNLALYCFIPFVVVITLNSLIIYRLNTNPNLLREESARSNSGSTSQPRERISVLLLTVSFTWFLLMLPFSLIGFVSFLHNVRVLRVVCFMLMYTNHSINFLLYCLTGRKFRHELMRMLKICPCEKMALKRGSSARSTLKTDLVPETIPFKPRRDRDIQQQRNHHWS